MHLSIGGKIAVCDFDTVDPKTTDNYLFKARKDYVRDRLFEQIDWSKYVSNMGAANVGGKSLVVKAYNDKKCDLNIKD